MKRLSILFMTLVSLNSLAQSKGDTFRKEGDLEKAIEAYKIEFAKNPEAKNNTYNLACAYALMYQKDSAFHYLNLALKNDNSLWALADNDLLSLPTDSRWGLVEKQQLDKYQKSNMKLRKPEYAKQLLRLIMKDQALDYQIGYGKTVFYETW